MNPCGFRAGLPKYLNGRLRPEPERAVVLHLESCPTCRRELARLRKLTMLVDAALYRPDGVEQFQARFLERFDRETRSAAESLLPVVVAEAPKRRWKPVLVPLAAAGALAALLLRPMADAPAPVVAPPPVPAVSAVAPVVDGAIVERGATADAVVRDGREALLERTIARDVELLDRGSAVAAAEGNDG